MSNYSHRRPQHYSPHHSQQVLPPHHSQQPPRPSPTTTRWGVRAPYEKKPQQPVTQIPRASPVRVSRSPQPEPPSSRAIEAANEILETLKAQGLFDQMREAIRSQLNQSEDATLLKKECEQYIDQTNMLAGPPPASIREQSRITRQLKLRVQKEFKPDIGSLVVKFIDDEQFRETLNNNVQKIMATTLPNQAVNDDDEIQEEILHVLNITIKLLIMMMKYKKKLYIF